MKEETEDFIKVYFEFFNDILDEEYVESLWAAKINEEEGLYRLENIPFFVTGYSSEDLVYAQMEDGRLVVKGLVEESGNSTLHIICFKEVSAGEIQNKLESFGCAWEGSHLPGYFSVEVPAKLSYKPIKEYLVEKEENEILSFREACLAHAQEE